VWLLALYDAFPGLPDDVSHKSGHVDGIFICALAEVFYKPFLRLIVDALVVMADAGFAESSF